MSDSDNISCFSEISDDEIEVSNVFKLVFVGNSGVGKTNLMTKFTRDEFTFETKPTIGLDFSTKTVRTGGHFIRMQIWDTAGQERYQSFTSTYFKDAVGIIVVYDITNQPSFAGLDKWLKIVEENINPERTSLLLIGNKIDLESDRQINTKEGKEFAEAHNMAFYETSAFDNRGNCIGKAFHALLKKIIPTFDFPADDKQEIKKSMRNVIDVKTMEKKLGQDKGPEVQGNSCCYLN